jgi:hypothetical protein
LKAYGWDNNIKQRGGDSFAVPQSGTAENYGRSHRYGDQNQQIVIQSKEDAGHGGGNQEDHCAPSVPSQFRCQRVLQRGKTESNLASINEELLGRLAGKPNNAS